MIIERKEDLQEEEFISEYVTPLLIKAETIRQIHNITLNAYVLYNELFGLDDGDSISAKDNDLDLIEVIYKTEL